jgi:capsid protein
MRSDTDTVIGQGLNLSPEPKHRILNLDPEAAKDWITDVKTRFELWAMSGRSSRNGRSNFFEAQRLMRKSFYRDGELFVALSYHNDPALISPLRFTILDPDQIRENGLTWTASGGAPWTQNRDGIIRNADGEETAYKVWKTDPNGITAMTEIHRTGRGGRVMMLHALTDQDYAGQLRGISPLAVCVQDLEHILDFTLSQVNKAIHQDNVTFTIESESDEAAQNPFTYLPPIGAPPGRGPAAGAFGNNPEPPPDAENVTEESVEPVYAPVSHTEINTPGSIGVYSLKGRQKLKPFPSDAFNVFVDAYFSYIAASTGWSIETVIKKFSNNYSASHATLILTWRVAEQLRWELDYYILGPVYEMWLAEEIAAGRISAPG